MLETTESLLPFQNPREKPRALLVSHDEEAFLELKRLLSTLSIESLSRVTISPRSIVSATYYGKGTLEGIKQLASEQKIQLIVFDVELSPNQLRNLEKELALPVLDRPGVIIEIFSQNARSKEAKTQVSLARLQYLLPRLKHFWNHFERQRGGGATSRGMGEKQIEVDRRLVKSRISTLKKKLKEIESDRQLHRLARKDILKVALVGYTNAGKSTLLNALTESNVLAEDKLFATLDSSVRVLSPHSHPPVVAIDTVGFISRLPPSLIASFKSTLEELREADLIVHVVDASSSQAREQITVVEMILKELNLLQTPRMTVFNKSDQLKGIAEKNSVKVLFPGAPLVSALDSEEVKKLRNLILGRFEQALAVCEVVIPYSESKLEAMLHQYSKVETKRYLEKGTFYRIRIDERFIDKLELKKYKV